MFNTHIDKLQKYTRSKPWSKHWFSTYTCSPHTASLAQLCQPSGARCTLMWGLWVARHTCFPQVGCTKLPQPGGIRDCSNDRCVDHTRVWLTKGCAQNTAIRCVGGGGEEEDIARVAGMAHAYGVSSVATGGTVAYTTWYCLGGVQGVVGDRVMVYVKCNNNTSAHLFGHV